MSCLITPIGVLHTPCASPISLSCVRLLAVTDEGLDFEGVDMLDQTPLIDIKPYVWTWDAHPGMREGWYRGLNLTTGTADGRFLPLATSPSRHS